MADTQEDDLPQLASLDSGDFIRIVENQATTPVSSIISRALFKAYLDTLYEPIGGGGTGWQTVTETWTRTGNHTFTVVGDLTLKYHRGTKVRYKDGGSFEYGVIAGRVFSSPNTTITLITNTDYEMAAGTITDTSISYQANPEIFPDWFNWDAAPTGFSAVPTLQVYRWSTHGRAITLAYSDGAIGTSNATTFTVTAPVLPATITNGNWTGLLGVAVDNGALTTTPGRANIASGSTTITLRKDTASGAWTASGGKRAVFTLIYEF